jgi:LDH2 family malate/lactate/ureidoglycolate dehydrogenase
LLAGTLGGAAMGRDVIDFNSNAHGVTNTGQAILVLDLAAFGDPAHFKQSVDRLVRDIRQSARLPGVERIWIPGEQSFEKRKKYGQKGIPLPGVVVDELHHLADSMGLDRLELSA